MQTANSSASKEIVTAALLVIGGKILSGRTNRTSAISRNIWRRSASISRKCGWSSMKRERSSMRSMRSGFAALESSPLAGSGVRCIDRHRSAHARHPARM